MITQPHTQPGIANRVPRERAAKNPENAPHPPTAPVIERPAARKSPPPPRRVKGIAVRFPSQPPPKASNPRIKRNRARKSLTLNPKIKTHTA